MLTAKCRVFGMAAAIGLALPGFGNAPVNTSVELAGAVFTCTVSLAVPAQCQCLHAKAGGWQSE